MNMSAALAAELAEAILIIILKILYKAIEAKEYPSWTLYVQ